MENKNRSRRPLLHGITPGKGSPNPDYFFIQGYFFFNIESHNFKEQFIDFNQLNANSFIKQTLGKQKITSITTLSLSTDHSKAGIRDIPLIQQNVNTTKLNASFWIEKMLIAANGKSDVLHLRNAQTINLAFPITGATLPIIWPHVTINTLTKTENDE